MLPTRWAPTAQAERQRCDSRSGERTGVPAPPGPPRPEGPMTRIDIASCTGTTPLNGASSEKTRDRTPPQPELLMTSTAAAVRAHSVHPSLRTPVAWGVVFGVLQ